MQAYGYLQRGERKYLVMQGSAEQRGERCGAHIVRHRSLALGGPCSSAWAAGPCVP